MKRIAITGGIAEGKSTVLGYIRDLGVDVESSDEIVARLYEDSEIQAELADKLFLEIPVTREKVREKLQIQPEIRQTLNQVFHCRVLDEILSSRATVVEVPLLIEACLQVHFERIWVVTCGGEEQWKRLVARYGDVAIAKKMLSSQLPSRAKCAFADVIVRTNRSEASVLDFTAECIKEEIS